MAFVIEPLINLFKKPDMTQVNKNSEENAALVKEMKQSLEETNKAIKDSIASIAGASTPFSFNPPGLPGYSPDLGAHPTRAPVTPSHSQAAWQMPTVSRTPFPPIG